MKGYKEMSLYENFFNSMLLFIVTIPLLIVIISTILELLIKNRFVVMILVFIMQVILYYGYSCIIVHMRIIDVGLDYIKYIAMGSLIFGFIGSSIGNFLNLYLDSKKFRKI